MSDQHGPIEGHAPCETCLLKAENESLKHSLEATHETANTKRRNKATNVLIIAIILLMGLLGVYAVWGLYKPVEVPSWSAAIAVNSDTREDLAPDEIWTTHPGGKVTWRYDEYCIPQSSVQTARWADRAEPIVVEGADGPVRIWPSTELPSLQLVSDLSNTLCTENYLTTTLPPYLKTPGTYRIRIEQTVNEGSLNARTVTLVSPPFILKAAPGEDVVGSVVPLPDDLPAFPPDDLYPR